MIDNYPGFFQECHYENNFLIHSTMDIAIFPTALTIETLDKRLLTVPKIEPGCVIEIPNEGMPCWHCIGETGSIFVSFEVIYPKNLSLTREEKDELKKLLAKEENNV